MSKKRMPPEVAEAIAERAGDWCEAMIPSVCVGPPQQIHHRQMRSQGGEHTVENGIFLCHACHSWVHAHPKWAYRAGLLVKSFDTPVFPPAFYRGRMTTREEEEA